ncbi:MAG: glutaredoxin family protein [Actinobacteria bacterium]|nr:glutaredoxin family protein [Actinomycetota bacterium]
MNNPLNQRRSLALMLTPVAAALVLAGCTSTGGTDTASESTASSPVASSPAASASTQESATPGGDASSSPKKSSSTRQAAPAGYVSYSDYSTNRAKYDDADVVLFFNASWCPTCMEADKQLQGASFPDGLVVVSVDYDDNQDLKQQYGVTTQHTFVQVDADGNQVTKFTGSTTVDEIAQQLA